MSGTATRTGSGTRAPESRGRGRTIGLWVLQVLLAAQFASAGILKLTGAESMVTMFDDIGAGSWLRFLVGVLEIAGAIGLLIPRLAGLAALGLVGLMVGALVTRVAVLDGAPVIEIVFLVLAGIVARARWSETKALLGRS
jgi:putative oxidoreductase